MMMVECQTRRQIDFKREDKIDAKKHIPIVFSHLSPLVTAFRVHEGHLNVVSSVGFVVVVPLQPTMHLQKNVPNKNENFKHHTYIKNKVSQLSRYVGELSLSMCFDQSQPGRTDSLPQSPPPGQTTSFAPEIFLEKVFVSYFACHFNQFVCKIGFYAY